MALGHARAIREAKKMFGPTTRIERGAITQNGTKTQVWMLTAPLLDEDKKPIVDAQGRPRAMALGVGATYEGMFIDAAERVRKFREQLAEHEKAAKVAAEPSTALAPVPTKIPVAVSTGDVNTGDDDDSHTGGNLPPEVQGIPDAPAAPELSEEPPTK